MTREREPRTRGPGQARLPGPGRTDWRREDDDDNQAGHNLDTGPDTGSDPALCPGPNWKMEPEIASYGESLTRRKKTSSRKYFNEAGSALTED